MQLILTIENGPQPEMEGRSWRCGTEGGTLGRNPECDLVLPDPKRYTSSVHARIEFDRDGFTLTDRSTNGTYHNSPKTLIGKNRSVSLDQGDRLFIGDFVLRVDVEDDESDEASAGPASGATSQFDRGDDFDAGRDGDTDGDSDSQPWDAGEFSVPWEGDGTEPNANEREANSGADDDDGASFSQSPEREYFAAPSVSASGGDAIPDDWDDFLTGFHDPSQAAKPESASSPAPEQTPRPDADRQSGSDTDSRRHEPNDGAGRKDAADRRTADETDTPFADAEPAPEERFEPPEARDSTPPEPESLEEPPPAEASSESPAQAPTRDERPQAPGPSRAGGSASDARIREILEVVTDGLMGLLQGRAEIKNEFRIAQTRFVRSENNPLKFSPDADEALKRILAEEDSPGFLTGRRAFEDAFDDIQAHQLAILSAVQRAIEAAVSQFEPAQIEKKLERISPISARTPGLRAAKCWNLFSMHYDEVAGKMRDDARQLFLAEFAEAYEEACRAVAEGKRQGRSQS